MAPAAKQFLHRPIGKAPVAPGDEAREIGLEIGAAEGPSGDRVVVQQQHAAVPDAGIGAA